MESTMESSTRFSSSLGRRSIVARIAAVLALAAAGLAIYLVVLSFTGDETEKTTNDRKGKNEQNSFDEPTYTVAGGDTLSGIAQKTGVPVAKLQRLNPDLDAETLNAGQVLNLRKGSGPGT